MSRRHLFAFALVAVIAVLGGCSSASSISMDEVDDRDLADRASLPAPDVSGGGSSAPAPDREVAAISAAIDDGSATVAADSAPFDPDRAFRSDGVYYSLSHEEVGSELGYEADVQVDYNASIVDGDVVAYEDLPPVDKRAVEPLLDRDHEPLTEGFDYAESTTYTESEAGSSALVPDQEYDAVRYEGEVYPVGVESSEATLTVYRYEATRIADSPEAYAAHLRDRYAFELSGLTDDERAIVDEARDGVYVPDDTNDEAFDSLSARFDDHEPVIGPGTDGTYIVRYEGDVYWTRITYEEFADG